MKRYGAQTVGFVTVTAGEADPNGIKRKTRVQVNVPGCRFRPLRMDEKTGLTNLATEMWKCTAPPHEAVLAADSVDELVYDGTDNPTQLESGETTYHIDGGIQPFTDFSKEPFKVTVLATKQTG